MDLQELRKKIDPIFRAVRKYRDEGVRIRGGYLIAVILKEIPNDIDVFIPESLWPKFLDEFSEYQFEAIPRQRTWYSMECTTHRGILHGFPIPVDIVTFTPEFDPLKHIDAHCRMVESDGNSIIFPTNHVYDDIVNRVFRFNVHYYVRYDLFLTIKEQVLKRSRSYLIQDFIVNWVNIMLPYDFFFSDRNDPLKEKCHQEFCNKYIKMAESLRKTVKKYYDRDWRIM